MKVLTNAVTVKINHQCFFLGVPLKEGATEISGHGNGSWGEIFQNLNILKKICLEINRLYFELQKGSDVSKMVAPLNLLLLPSFLSSLSSKSCCL